MRRRIVDLTFPLREGMTTFPRHWHPVVEVTVLGRHGVEGRETRKLVLGTHTGTHCDAPRHFVEGGDTVDQMSLDTLIGPAVVLDLSKRQEKGEVGTDGLKLLLRNRRPERLILRFDWCRHIDSAKYYTHHPYLSQDAAKWLVEQGVRLLAMDTPTPDNPAQGSDSPVDSPVHKILLRSGVILVEYLCNLRHLRTDEPELIVLPLRVFGGDGAPVRCVAIESVGEEPG